MAHGKHRKPNDTTTNMRRIALGASVALGGSMVPVAFGGSANAAPLDAWESIADCESGSWLVSSPDGPEDFVSGSADWDRPDGDNGKSSGGLQFQPASWNDALAYLRSQGVDTSDYPQGSGHQAYKATKRQQIIAGEALLAMQGPGAWVCNKYTKTLASSGPNASMFKGGDFPYADLGGQDPADPKPPADPPAADPSPLVSEILTLVNAERAKASLPPLVADASLNKFADDWSRTMAHGKGLEHSNLGFAGSPRGENIAVGQSTAAAVMADWMNSPGHKANILGSGYTKLGVGVHDEGGKLWWTQVFAGGSVTAPPVDPPADPPVDPPADPAPPTDPAPPAPPAGDERPEATTPHDHYKVKRGDTLHKIATALKVEGGWEELYRWNTKVTPDPDVIYPGQVLNVPRATYTVKAGDTLWSIAKAHGINHVLLYAANVDVVGGDPDVIEVGQKLAIPRHYHGHASKPAPKPAPAAPAAPKAPKATGYAKPINAPLSGAYGKAGAMWSLGYHTGADFAAPHGTPVFAAADGKVVGSKSGGSYGSHVVIDHGNGKYTLYAHLSSRNVWAGQSVKAGDKIGAVGSTGNSSGPHLHLELRNSATAFNKGVFSDPVAWLRANGVKM